MFLSSATITSNVGRFDIVACMQRSFKSSSSTGNFDFLESQVVNKSSKRQPNARTSIFCMAGACLSVSAL